MSLTAFLLTQMTPALKAQIKIDLNQFKDNGSNCNRRSSACRTLTRPYQINPITRLLAEGISFVVVYKTSLRLFKIVEKWDFRLLRKHSYTNWRRF